MIRTTAAEIAGRVYEDAALLVRELLPPPMAVLAPHPDDETLGCGGLLALHPAPDSVSVVFATDGERSHVAVPGAPPPDEMRRVRRREATRALEVFGIDPSRTRFLALPDGGLRRARALLETRLSEALAELRPRSVALPFRKDRHPDHVELTRAAASLLARLSPDVAVAEYFIYPIWERLGNLDIRGRVDPDRMVVLVLGSGLAVKRRACEWYTSQLAATSVGAPVVPPDALETLLAPSECFLYSRSLPLRDEDVRWSALLELYLRLECGTQRVREIKRSVQNRIRSARRARTSG